MPNTIVKAIMSTTSTGGEHGESGGDGLQLERDVRHDAHGQQHRHQGGQGLRFRISSRDEVGDARDVMRVFQLRDASEDAPTEQQCQGRAQVHREKAQTGGSGLAHTSIVSPRAAVDRKAHGEHSRMARPALAPRGALGPLREQKEHGHVGEYRSDDRECGEHQRGPSVSVSTLTSLSELGSLPRAMKKRTAIESPHIP
jgi:hypothetical protein